MLVYSNETCWLAVVNRSCKLTASKCGKCLKYGSNRCAACAGSPFQYTVGKSAEGGTHKVDFGGVGVEKGQVGMKSERLS